MARERAVIVGAGDGLSAAVARRFAAEGASIALVARNVDKLKDLAIELKAEVFGADASQPDAVMDLFAALDLKFGIPDFVLYNPSARARGPLVELEPEAVRTSLLVSAYGGFLVAQQAAKRMLAREGGASGSLFFTGASASVKGYPQSAPFAMGKFALRGLAQSLARELAPKNIHVAHFVIDGGIAKAGRPGYEPGADGPDSRLDPDAIAETYHAIHRQQRSAWTWRWSCGPGWSASSGLPRRTPSLRSAPRDPPRPCRRGKDTP